MTSEKAARTIASSPLKTKKHDASSYETNIVSLIASFYKVKLSPTFKASPLPVFTFSAKASPSCSMTGKVL